MSEIHASALTEPPSTFAEQCNRFLRALGCNFCGNSPGLIVEGLADTTNYRSAPPTLQTVADLVSGLGDQFHFSPEAERAFGSLWRILTHGTDPLVLTQNALAAMRVFVALVEKSSPMSPALEVLDKLAAEVERQEERSLLVSGSSTMQVPPQALSGTFTSSPGTDDAGQAMSAQALRIFISYSRLDAAIVVPITGLMRVVGAKAFMDRDSIVPGQLWRQVIFTAIKDADLLIVFWSKNAATSENVRAEWTYGRNERKTIVPVLLDSTQLDPRLEDYQWLDMRSISVVAVGRDERGATDELLALRLDAEPVAAAVVQLMNRVSGLA